MTWNETRDPVDHTVIDFAADSIREQGTTGLIKSEM